MVIFFTNRLPRKEPTNAASLSAPVLHGDNATPHHLQRLLDDKTALSRFETKRIARAGLTTEETRSN